MRRGSSLAGGGAVALMLERCRIDNDKYSFILLFAIRTTVNPFSSLYSWGMFVDFHNIVGVVLRQFLYSHNLGIFLRLHVYTYTYTLITCVQGCLVYVHTNVLLCFPRVNSQMLFNAM